MRDTLGYDFIYGPGIKREYTDSLHIDLVLRSIYTINLALPAESVQDFYTNKQLIAITRELTDALRTNKTIDWTMKESAHTGMRRIVKRLLKKYKYPPEGQEAALETIMTQCEMWSQNEFN